MRLLLRFANLEGVDTIARHREVLLGAGEVWWGWFKKTHEPFPIAELQSLAAAVPMEVGLVNRAEQTFYAATCEAIVLTDRDGVAIPTPDFPRTPRYYADAYLPGWFRFSALRSVNAQVFEERFGGVPEGDPTMFLVRGGADQPRLESPLPDSVPAPLPAKGRSILHVSDLHFGEFHGFPESSGPGSRPLDSILTDFLATASDVSVGGIVASGDFISKGDANDFVPAESFVRKLAAACNLGLEYVVTVPGNHDIWLQDSQNFDRDYRIESPYRMFIRSLYGADINEIEGVSTLQTSNGWTVTLLGLNSARARTQDLKEYGYIGHDRYGPWLDRVKVANGASSALDLVENRRLNIAVLHHHLLPAGLVSRPAEPRPVSLTLDAGAIVADFQDACIHLALHGHEHLPCVATTGRVRREPGNAWSGPDRRLAVLGSGSTGGAVTQLSPEEPNNTFSLYTPLDSSLQVQVFRFNSAVAPEPLMDFELPL